MILITLVVLSRKLITLVISSSREICVDESKSDISSKDAVEKIRSNVYFPNTFASKKELQAEIDYENGKISAETYRKIMLGE